MRSPRSFATNELVVGQFESSRAAMVVGQFESVGSREIGSG
jgi:hypothetical protein